jgi:iron complex outermembrane recepter protein
LLLDTWTVDHIEVLGGPGSVLYGVGAIGGTINVVPRKPDTQQQQNDVQFSAGSFDTFQEAIDSTGPLSQNLAYRFDLSHVGSDGWIDRGDSHSLAVSGTLQDEVTPDLRLSLSEDYGDQSPMEYWGTPLIAGALNNALIERNFTVPDSFMKFIDSVTQFKVDWSPTDALSVHDTLYLLATHREWHDLESYAYQPASGDVLRSGYFLIHHNELQVGDEGHVTYRASLLGLKNEVEAGFDINGIHFTNSNNSPYAGSSLVDPFDFSPGYFVSQGPFRTTTATDTREYAVFAEDRLELRDNLSVVVGGRYDYATLAYTDPSIGTPSYDGTGQDFDKSFYSPSYRAGLVYQPIHDLSLYAQYSTATAALGSLITTTLSQADFKLASGRQVEIGAKQSFWDNRGEWTLAAYRIVQDNLLTPDPTNPTISEQVGQQSSRGVEAAVALSLAAGWRIEANGTVLKARYDDFAQSVDGVSVSRDGKVPPNVPESAANLFVSWQITHAWQLRAGSQYVSHRYADSGDTLPLPAYDIASAGVRWTPVRDLALDLRVDNALDRIYPLVAGNGGTQWILGEPRFVTFTANYRF